MIKTRHYPIFATLLITTLVTQTLFADSPWFDLVRQRLDLEQANPDALVIDKRYNPEDKKRALDHALGLYHNRFEKFYKDVMPIIDPCREWCDTKESLRDKRKHECKEWCDLKDYLEESKKRLGKEYNNLKQRYRVIILRSDSEDNKLKSYETDLKNYYNDIIEVLKKTIVEGQEKEVKLFKEAVKEIREEKIKEKHSDEAAIMQEEE